MASFSIPERYQLGVSKIRDLDLEAVRAMRHALDNLVYSDHEPKPVTTAAIALKAISPIGTKQEDYRNIAEALVSLYLVKSSHELPLDEFTDRIANALEALPNQELRLRSAERDLFKEKLGILLGAEMFGVVSKVSDLRTESENIFCHARILTDLRPVFGADVDRGPVAMLVAHNLKIAYHLSGRKGDHDFYVSLDADDLSALKDVIARAEAKAKTLKSAISDKVRLFGVSE